MASSSEKVVETKVDTGGAAESYKQIAQLQGRRSLQAFQRTEKTRQKAKNKSV
jgi:hypothetical protein